MNDELKLQQKFFDEQKNQYSSNLIPKPPFHTKLEIKAILQKIKRIKTGSFVADFGAGSGRITVPLLQKGYNVTSIDLSKKSLQNIRVLATSLKLRSLKTIESFPNDKRFDAIVGADVLHHINLDIYLPKLYKILEKSGMIVFSEPGGFNPSWYMYLPIFYDWQVEKGVMTCSFFNLKNKFNIYGFKNIKIEGLGLFPRSLLNWSKTICKLNDYIGNLPLLNFFAYRYIISATKL